MAKGLAYYNVETDRFSDIKIKRLRKALGCMGYAVYEYILCEIYRVGGGVLEWDESRALDVSDYWGISESQVTEVVNNCVAVGLFDKDVLKLRGALTSHGIQTRYAEICKKTHRRLDIPTDLCLLFKQKIEGETSRQTNDLSRQTPHISKRKENNPLLSPQGDTPPPKAKSWSWKVGEAKPEWIAPDMEQIFSDWLAYKRTKGQSYKTEASARTCYKHLIDLASSKPETARAIVEQSIACNYAGLFALKTGGANAPTNNFISQNNTTVYEKF